MKTKSKLVHVLLTPEGKAGRIFRTKAWLDFPEDQVVLMERSHAVRQIREQVFERTIVALADGSEINECERCGRSINWATMEMHETIPKGKHGEVSLANCEALCHNCHQGNPDSVHGNRRWQTAKIG